MKKYSIALNLAMAVSAFGLATMPAMALTPPALKITDGTNTITIDATGVPVCVGTCTTSSVSGTGSQAGSISWMGTLGSFTVTAAQGQSRTSQFAYPDLAIVAQNTGAAQGTLTATWSDIGYTGGPIDVQSVPITTFAGGVGSAVYSYYTDNTNTLFGTGSLVGTLSNVTDTPASTPIWGSTTTSAVFAATEVEAITLAAGATFNGDNQMQMFNEPLTVSCATASGKMGTAYSSTVGVAGGIAPYAFTLANGTTLPPGLSLNATSGAVTGTPTVAGTFSYTIQITDSQGYVALSTCGMTIALGGGGGQAGLTLTCPSTSVTQSTQYSSSFVATGGIAPYSFSISSGSLPKGLTLKASTGAVTGKATTVGTYTFTGKVVDSTTGTALSTTSTCTMTVVAAPAPLTLSCATNSGTVGTAYSSKVVASGGTAPYKSYKLTSGKLPAGLTLDTTTGNITGTPTAAGTYSYQIQVTDANGALTTDGSGSGCGSTSGCSIKIAAPAPLSLKCPSSTSKVGVAYSSAATAAGGKAPYTFSLTKGALPAGLKLNASTGAITGTPTTPGTANFTITVKDSSGATNGTQNCGGGCSIVVAPAITISCPPGSATKGTAYKATLTVTGGTAPYTFSITSGSLPNGVTLDPKTGILSGTPTASGSFSVAFKVVDSKGLVGVTSCNNSSCNSSDGNGWGGNGWGGDGWGGDDENDKNGNCVATIKVCEPGQYRGWGDDNWGWW